MSKTPEQLAEEWSEIQYQEQEFIGAKLGTERAFLAGYQAGYNEAKKYWVNQPKYDADPEWIEKANKYVFNRSAWADMIEKHKQEKKDK